jgi:hypothetical protein
MGRPPSERASIGGMHKTHIEKSDLHVQFPLTRSSIG